MNRKGQIIFWAWTIAMIVAVIVILGFLWETNPLRYKKLLAPYLVLIVIVGGFIWFVVYKIFSLSPALKSSRDS